MHINYISNEKYLQMHLFSWQSIDWVCKANIYHLVTVGSTILIEYVLLEEQMLSHNFFSADRLYKTQSVWGWLLVGTPRLKQPVSVQVTAETCHSNTTESFSPSVKKNVRESPLVYVCKGLQVYLLAVSQAFTMRTKSFEICLQY